MKYKITKAIGVFADESSVGLVHLSGPHDTYACGLADEDYVAKETSKPITCSTCLAYLGWARQVAKIKQ